MINFLRANAHQAPRAAPVIAAIDLGTNSCRLLIARVQEGTFRIIDSFSRVVRLGEGIEESGCLTSDAIQRALDALKICQEKISHHNVLRLRAVTTEACRRATNAAAFLARVKEETGLTLELITAAEEARLALTGCAAILNTRIPYALAFDIGGGSTEVLWLKINEPRRIHRRRAPVLDVLGYTSIPYGVVTLADKYKGQINPTACDKIRDEVCERLTDFSEKNGILDCMIRARVQMIGTSGTVTTLAAMQMGLKRYDRRMIDGAFLATDDIYRISDEIGAMSISERSEHPCIGSNRSELVLMGTSILQGICDTWPVTRLRVADRGVREGILMDLVRELSYRNRNTVKIISPHDNDEKMRGPQ